MAGFNDGFGNAANADESTYDFVLKYYAKGQDGASDECFVWGDQRPGLPTLPLFS